MKSTSSIRAILLSAKESLDKVKTTRPKNIHKNSPDLTTAGWKTKCQSLGNYPWTYK